MSETVTSNIRSVPLDALVFSQTPAQVERRAHFNQVALQELSETIKAAGRPEQLITVRPCPFREVDEDRYEVADGERRCIAAKMAGLTEILCDIRDLSDDQVLDIQIVTGLQKEGLHELVEAEGYDLLSKRGLSADEIAAKVGKSKAYVYARIKLLALDPASRAAMYDGKLSASIALLIARIPVASLQRKALGEILNPRWGQPMSYREAQEHIHDTYMLRLEEAPFPTDTVGLVRNVGSCGSCPKRTGNQPQLFEDVKGADVCTDPTCFKAKREAWGKQQLSEAKTMGQKVIAGADAKKIKPHEFSDNLQGGYVQLDAKCWDDPKGRTYRQLLAGKDVEIALLQVPKSGDIVQIVQQKTAMKAAGIKRPTAGNSPNSGLSASAKAEKAKREREEAFRVRVLKEIQGKAPKVLERADLEAIAIALFDSGCEDEEIFEQLGWTEPPGRDWKRFSKAVPGQLKVLSLPQLNGVILTLVLGSAVGNQTYDAKHPRLEETAKRLKIDVEKIRKVLALEEHAKTLTTPTKASKKKARK